MRGNLEIKSTAHGTKQLELQGGHVGSEEHKKGPIQKNIDTLVEKKFVELKPK